MLGKWENQQETSGRFLQIYYSLHSKKYLKTYLFIIICQLTFIKTLYLEYSVSSTIKLLQKVCYIQNNRRERQLLSQTNNVHYRQTKKKMGIFSCVLYVRVMSLNTFYPIIFYFWSLKKTTEDKIFGFSISNIVTNYTN